MNSVGQLDVKKLAESVLLYVFNFGIKASLFKRINYPLFSKHQPSGPMVSISRNVRLCVCPSVLFLRYPEVPEVQSANFLEIRNPRGKVMERSCLKFEPFCSKMV